jgi:hypothetical protein
MSGEERELVLYKRKLRNRESARRSRQKRQATLAELQEEVDELVLVAGRMLDVGQALRAKNDAIQLQLDVANATIAAMRAAGVPAVPIPPTTCAADAERPSTRTLIPAAECAKLGG